MRVYLVVEGRKFAAVVPHAGADLVRVAVPCSGCGSPASVAVSGMGVDSYGHDYEEAPAVARCCGRRVGRMRVEYETIFGVEEDRRVLAGRCRVY